MKNHALAEGDRSTNNQMNSIKTVFPEYTHGENTPSNKTGALTKSYPRIKFSKKVVSEKTVLCDSSFCYSLFDLS